MSTIVTWNVNGIRARAAQVLDYLTTRQPGVLCLQEIKASAEQIPDEVTHVEGYVLGTNGAPTGYSGVAIFVRQDLAEGCAFRTPPFDFENRALEAHLPALELSIVNLYCPNGGKAYEPKLTFYDGLLAFAADRRAAGLPTWLTGDFNIAHTDRDLHPKERQKADIGVRPEERARFSALLGHGLTDVFRREHPDTDDQFTWWPYAPWAKKANHGWRIDYHLVPEAVAAQVATCEIDRTFGSSDHVPVVATRTR